TVDELEHQRAAPDDDGYADDQTEDDIVQLVIQMRVLGSAGNGNDVVQAHDEVGNQDGLDGGPHGTAALDIAVLIFVGNQQLHTNPPQQGAADQLQEGNGKQRERKGDQQDAQDDGARRTPQDALHALLALEIAASQRDHNGIVSAQQDIDQ